MKSLILACAALALVSCAAPGPVFLRNMVGATVKCGPYPVDARGSDSSAQREAQCISDYQRQGYERVPG